MAPEVRQPVSAAAFLRAHPPFDAVDPADVERVACAAELERHPAGTTIFAQGGQPLEHLRVIVDGAVEIESDGRVVDLLGAGDAFGYASMLSGLPPGFEARAVRDTSCYRIGAAQAETLLSGPAGLRFVARSLLAEPTELHVLARDPARNIADQPVGTLLRGEPVVCGPRTPIREAARMMSAGPSTAVVVDLGDGKVGILTDHDLRHRVVAAGLSGDAPISAAMTAPAYTCSPDRRAGDLLLEMLDRGFRHFPVVSGQGTILGVVDDGDLVALRTRSSFYLRQRIAAAGSIGQLTVVARELRPMVIGLHDARVASANVMAVYAVCVDALTRRMLELVVRDAEPPGVKFAWLALGSQARREALPSSDIDSAIVWFDDAADAGPDGGDAGADGERRERATRDRLVAIAGQAIAGLRESGMRTDENGVNADSALFVRSVASWQRLARSWIADPTQEKALILSSVLVDSRPVWGVHTGTPVADTFRLATHYPTLLRLLCRFALSHRPPTGLFRPLIVAHGGEHRGRLDLKQGGLLPILDLARWGAISAGVTIASTPERLRAAAAAGTLAEADARTLQDAFELINDLRLEHQVQQLRAGEAPDDQLDPHELSVLKRAQLREAFRAVAGIQKHVSSELSVGVH